MHILQVRKFFDSYRREFGPLKSVDQVKAIENFLNFIFEDPFILDIREAAYMFATVKHETADTYLPVKEAYWKDERWRAKNLRYFPWYGRGYVQLTWETNYKKAQRELKIDLTTNPDVVMDPQISYQIMSQGMRNGWFTGKALSNYITDNSTNYIGARYIINGTDKASLIAKYAEEFEKCLGNMSFSSLKLS